MEEHILSPVLFPTSLNEGDGADKEHFLSSMKANFTRLPERQFKTVREDQKELAHRIKMKVGKKGYDPPFWRDQRLLSKQDRSPERAVSAGRVRSVNPRYEVEFPSPKSPTTTTEEVATSLSLSRKIRVLSAVKGEQTKSWH